MVYLQDQAAFLAVPGFLCNVVTYLGCRLRRAGCGMVRSAQVQLRVQGWYVGFTVQGLGFGCPYKTIGR